MSNILFSANKSNNNKIIAMTLAVHENLLVSVPGGNAWHAFTTVCRFAAGCS